MGTRADKPCKTGFANPEAGFADKALFPPAATLKMNLTGVKEQTEANLPSLTQQLMSSLPRKGDAISSSHRTCPESIKMKFL